MADISVLTSILKHALWNTGAVPAIEIKQDIYEEMCNHKIASLAIPILDDLVLPQELLEKWEKNAAKQFFCYTRYLHEELNLPVSVPFVILKGTAAAQYYPYPEYRTMGDIDIMTSHENYSIACGMLLENGYTEITDFLDKEHVRHRQFRKNTITIEVHQFYAVSNDLNETRFLDELIISHITDTHILPDLINGLTLLEHINNHMEGGLGLRQIIDWMMFVDRCLPDEKWTEFKLLLEKTDLEKLALITTRMCEIYLGLPERQWCSAADPDICEELWKYVLTCGNFGRKQSMDEAASTIFLSGMETFKGTIRTLRKRGIVHWKAAQKYSFLQSIAWLYQLLRFFILGFRRKQPIRKLIIEYKNSRYRNALFDSLGVARAYKGIAIYKDGIYTKNKR